MFVRAEVEHVKSVFLRSKVRNVERDQVTAPGARIEDERSLAFGVFGHPVEDEAGCIPKLMRVDKLFDQPLVLPAELPDLYGHLAAGARQHVARLFGDAQGQEIETVVFVHRGRHTALERGGKRGS